MRWTGILLVAAMACLPVSPGIAIAQRSAQSLPPGIKDPPLRLGPAGNQSNQSNPSNGSNRSDPKNAVQFLYPAQVTVGARRPVVVDLKFHVATGLHINSHTPREKTLVPTRLAVVEDSGIGITAVDFPPGADYAFAFSPKEKVSVYTGDFTLQAHLTAQPGEHRLEGLLHYQACDVNACMPPRTLPISIGVLAK